MKPNAGISKEPIKYTTYCELDKENKRESKNMKN